MKCDHFHLVAMLLLLLPTGVDAASFWDFLCWIPILKWFLCNDCSFNNEPCGDHGDCVGKFEAECDGVSTMSTTLESSYSFNTHTHTSHTLESFAHLPQTEWVPTLAIAIPAGLETSVMITIVSQVAHGELRVELFVRLVSILLLPCLNLTWLFAPF